MGEEPRRAAGLGFVTPCVDDGLVQAQLQLLVVR